MIEISVVIGLIEAMCQRITRRCRPVLWINPLRGANPRLPIALPLALARSGDHLNAGNQQPTPNPDDTGTFKMGDQVLRGAWLQELSKHQPLAVPLMRAGIVDKLPKRPASLS